METLAAKLQTALDAQVAEYSVPGANAAVSIDGRLAWSGACGVLEPGSRAPLPADSFFPIYSITKTFAAACALRLAEREQLDLDEHVATWLPELPFADRVTLRQLLGHTAGVPNYSALAAYHDAVRKKPGCPWSFDEFVARTCAQPLDFAPGGGFSYSNTGYTLVKRILELATGTSFGEVLGAEVARPLGLTHTRALETLSDMEAVVPGCSAIFDGEPRDVRPLYHPGWCGTGLVASTASELCHFFDALFAGAIVGATHLSQMLTLVRVPGEHPPAVSPSYGLGIMGDPDGRLGGDYGHGGGGPGWDLFAMHWPALGGESATVAVLCNQDGERAPRIVGALGSLLAGVDR